MDCGIDAVATFFEFEEGMELDGFHKQAQLRQARGGEKFERN